MLKLYLTTAFREISKNKIFSVIHIIGLSTGIAAFIIILRYAHYEMSYDRFYENAGTVYRIRQDRYDKGRLSTTWGAGCPAVGPAIKREFPEVKDVGILNGLTGIVSVEEKSFRIDRMYVANSNFLSMLPVRMITGSDSSALDEPNTVIVSESVAKKIFGNSDVLEKTIKLDNEVVFKITGVFADIPENTHLKFNILFSWPTMVKMSGNRVETAWGWDGFLTYIRLAPETNVNDFEKKMNAFAKKEAESLLAKYDQSVEYSLQPFRSIHLHSDLMWEAEPNGNAATVYFLILIAFIILIVAWVNYINLSSVKAVFRSKEIAVRKISGARRIQLITQFVTESFVLNFIASLIALLLAVVSMPFFRTLTGKELALNTPVVWIIFISLIVAGPILSGLYPALLTSSFSPMAVFRGRSEGMSGSAPVRKILIVFQFAASTILIAGTFTIYSQLRFMKSQDTGVNIDRTLILRGPSVADSTFVEKMATFKSELLRSPLITAVASSTCVPGGKVSWNAGGVRRSSEDDKKGNQYRVLGVDYDFIDLYDLSVLTGRSFSRDYGSDEQSVMFNESAIRLMGFETPEEAVGESIFFWGNNYRIVGVLKNYHQESLKKNFDALIFRLMPGVRDNITVRLTAGEQKENDYSAVISTIKENWDNFFPGNPFDYYLLSDHYESQYREEDQFMTIFKLFALLAIVIACLGLFGLSWFIIARRTKEAGIRKVNGASVTSIFLLISRDFSWLVLTGILLAAPVTWYFSVRWLEKFAYKIAFSWGLYAISALIIILVAAFAIGYNVSVIARINPAVALREQG